MNATSGPLQPRRVDVALTGASGVAYGLRLLQRLDTETAVERVRVMVSRAGADVCRLETGIALAGPASLRAMGLAKAEWVSSDDISAAAASGTGAASAMVIVPCSMSTLGALASGAGRNLIHRAADVVLKERRPLVVVPRETPLNEIHLRNMLRLHRAGAVILPASPAFYTFPGRVEDLVDHLVSRMLSVLGFDIPPGHRWHGPPSK